MAITTGPNPAGAKRRTRVVVVDDHDLFRAGLCRLLRDELTIQVVGDAPDGEQAAGLVAARRPDVVVMDIHLPGMSGIDATRAIRALAPDTAVLMLTVSTDEEEILEAVLAGASGYLLKDAPLAEIVRAIRCARAGQSLLAPSVAASLVARVRRQGRPDAGPSGARGLSPREEQVLALLVAGWDNAAIGRHLHVSASTVKHHVSSLLEKLGVENRVQAAVLAVREDLVDEPATAGG